MVSQLIDLPSSYVYVPFVSDPRSHRPPYAVRDFAYDPQHPLFNGPNEAGVGAAAQTHRPYSTVRDFAYDPQHRLFNGPIIAGVAALQKHVAATIPTPASDPDPDYIPEGSLFQPVPYSTYTKYEVFCYKTDAAHPERSVTVSTTIRQYMASYCTHANTKLDSGIYVVQQANMPKGDWNIAFAPMVLERGGWMLVFALPQESEQVWFWWPRMGGRTGSRVFRYLEKCRRVGMLEKRDGMVREEGDEGGDGRHLQFWRMVVLAVQSWEEQYDVVG